MIGLGDFLALVDRLVALSREKQKSQRSFFEEILDPLFENCEVIADSYLKFFRQARGVLVDGDDLRASIDLLRNSRQDIFLSRAKAVELVRALKSRCASEEEVEFLRALKTFFLATQVKKEVVEYRGALSATKREATIRHIELLAHAEEAVQLSNNYGDGSGLELSRQDVEAYIIDTCQRLEAEWQGVVVTYTELKLQALGHG